MLHGALGEWFIGGGGFKHAYHGVFTGAAFSSDVSSFFERVDNELLEKPFDPPELRALVRRFTTKGPPAAT